MRVLCRFLERPRSRVFFFKQKTAYEWRISDWSSDVCSADLQADTTLVALDARTGEVKWSVKNGDPSKGETGTMAPMVAGDKVLIGVSGGEFGIQGHITAYNMSDGSIAWRGYSQGPDDMLLVDPEQTTHLREPIGADSSLTPWEGDQWTLGGGAGLGWLSYDPELNLVYYGSGNPGTWNPVQQIGRAHV